MQAHHFMSVPAEAVAEWCWRSGSSQHLLISWTCHVLWHSRSLCWAGTFTLLLVADRWATTGTLWPGPSTHQEPCSTQICSCFMSALTGARDCTDPRTMHICPGSLLLEHPQPATPRVSVCINQCNDEWLFSGEPLLCALPDLNKFPYVISPYQPQRNPSKQRLDQTLSVSSES